MALMKTILSLEEASSTAERGALKGLLSREIAADPKLARTLLKGVVSRSLRTALPSYFYQEGEPLLQVEVFIQEEASEAPLALIVAFVQDHAKADAQLNEVILAKLLQALRRGDLASFFSDVTVNDLQWRPSSMGGSSC